MSIVLFAPTFSMLGTQFEQVLVTGLRDEQVRVVRSANAAVEWLREVNVPYDLAILFADNEQMLKSIVESVGHTNPANLVLVLPNHRRSTIQTGERLHPVLIGYLDDDYERIMQNIHEYLQTKRGKNNQGERV